MELRILCKHLVADELNGKFTVGEDFADVVGINLPRFYDRHDLSQFLFRITAAGESKNAAVQILEMDSFDEKSIHLLWNVTSDFTAISEKFTLVLTGVNSDNSAAIKFKSCPIAVNSDETWEFMPSPELSEQLLNQTQSEVQKAIEAANRAENASQTPAPAEIYPAAAEKLGGILSGNDISVDDNGTVTVNSVNGKTVEKSVPENAVFTDTVYTLPEATTETLGGVKVDGVTITASSDGTISASQANAPAEAYPATAEKLGGILSGNDISVDDNGTVTVNSVNGKTVEKSVPENAVFTDTVYTLPEATTETLGGVKVDGITITASSDGTISASQTIANISDLSVQIAHPNNFLIYDNAGKPSVMVAIPKFYLDDVISGASHTVHPAFIINGVEQDVIYISKYQNIVEDGRAYSLPMKDPAVNINFDQAWNYCKNKGAGWHLMTNAEWAAIALWCKKNGTLPKGNNNYGKDISETDLPPMASAANRQSDGKVNRVLTGSGRESWYHNGMFSGIADLNGNVWEWNSGLRLVDGEIQILVNNNAADWNNSVSSNSVLWKAIKQDGSLVEPGTDGTLKWDYINSAASETSSFHLTNALEHKQTSDSVYGYKAFENLAVKSGVNVPEILKSIAVFPADSNGYEGDVFMFRNIGERLLFCGSNWSSGVKAGMFGINLNYSRTGSSNGIGFRCAYYVKN